MSFEIARDYSDQDLREFEDKTGRAVDFTLIPAWTRAAESSGYAKGIRVIARRGGKPAAILQGTIRSRFGLRKFLCGSTSGAGVAWQSGEEEAALKCLEAVLTRIRPQLVQVFSPTPLDVDGLAWSASFSFQILLDRPFEAILASMDKRARHAARRAERLGVTVEEVADPDRMNEAYDVVEAAARERDFVVPPRAYSLALHREFESVGSQRCFVARVRGHVVSAVSVLGYGAKLVWWKGGSLPEGYRTSAGNALQVAAIRWARDHRFQFYDLGGTDPLDSTYAGIHSFKASFGGIRTETSTGRRVTALARKAVALRNAFRHR